MPCCRAADSVPIRCSPGGWIPRYSAVRANGVEASVRPAVSRVPRPKTPRIEQGARRRDRLAEALGSLDVTLTAKDIAAIELAVPKDAAAGARYPGPAMADLDSERWFK